MPALAVIAVSFLPFFEAKNDAALRALAPDAPGPAPAAERPRIESALPCPVCGGRGGGVLEEQDFGQGMGRIGRARRVEWRCRACGGARRIECFGDPDALAFQAAKDRAAFESAHQARGDIAAGFAYVPNEAWRKATKQDRKIVAHAYGEPCRTCNWLGIEPCRTCSGSGARPCPAKDCKGGWAVTKKRGAHRTDKVSVAVCPVCGGAGAVICPDCQGRRAKPCRKCSGTGLKRKAGAP